MQVPIVSISGHQAVPGVTNIQLNHKLAARLAIKHLADLGHRRVAFMKGQEQTVDTDYRWKEILDTARACGMELHQELLIKLTENSWSPALGYGPVKALLSRTRDFTALFAFNDIAAFGAIRALHEAGLRVPDDVSVIGFDDVLSAPFHIPSLTTIRQPLREMGKTGAECLINRINHPKAPYAQQVIMQPELMVRESTAVASSRYSSVVETEQGFAQPGVTPRWARLTKQRSRRSTCWSQTLERGMTLLLQRSQQLIHVFRARAEVHRTDSEIHFPFQLGGRKPEFAALFDTPSRPLRAVPWIAPGPDPHLDSGDRSPTAAAHKPARSQDVQLPGSKDAWPGARCCRSIPRSGLPRIV